MPRIIIKKNTAAVSRRIKALPIYLESSIKLIYKKDADAIIKEYTKGIQSNSLGLEGLKPGTIYQKRLKGYTNPNTPLLGKGGDRSYSELLKVYIYKKSIRITPSRGKHHSGIEFRIIFFVHEFGATIRKKTKNGTRTIRIPPRPAMMIAYMKVIKRIKKNGHPELKKAVNEYIKTGEKRYFGAMNE